MIKWDMQRYKQDRSELRVAVDFKIPLMLLAINTTKLLLSTSQGIGIMSSFKKSN
jgi:hypothetical protein